MYLKYRSRASDARGRRKYSAVYDSITSEGCLGGSRRLVKLPIDLPAILFSQCSLRWCSFKCTRGGRVFLEPSTRVRRCVAAGAHMRPPLSRKSSRHHINVLWLTSLWVPKNTSRSRHEGEIIGSSNVYLYNLYKPPMPFCFIKKTASSATFTSLLIHSHGVELGQTVKTWPDFRGNFRTSEAGFRIRFWILFFPRYREDPRAGSSFDLHCDLFPEGRERAGTIGRG